MRLIDYNFRYSTMTNKNLWLAGTSWQEIPCAHPVSGVGLTCKVYGVAVDDRGAVGLNYASVSNSDIGPTDIRDQLRPHDRSARRRCWGDASWCPSRTSISSLDFALSAADPAGGFWNIANRWQSGAFRAMGARIPGYCPQLLRHRPPVAYDERDLADGSPSQLRVAGRNLAQHLSPDSRARRLRRRRP